MLQKWADVAPHTGAWIETKEYIEMDTMRSSHPTRVRGLKPIKRASFIGVVVAPHTGAWIETHWLFGYM